MKQDVVREKHAHCESSELLCVYEKLNLNFSLIKIVGKTTQVPQYIMEHCTAANERCRIICTQPRRLNTVSIAKRVSMERNDILGRSVGYQIRLDSRLSPHTNLIYTTSGSLLRRLTGSSYDKAFNSITHLILDESHEREKITDFLMIAIKDAIKDNPHLKVILMSATIESNLFSTYFNNAPVINVHGRLFDVEVKYLDDILNMTGYMPKKMQTFMQENDAISCHKNDRTMIAYHMTKKQNAQDIDHELLHALIVFIHETQRFDGGILVFLPGYDDIMAQKEYIETRATFGSCQLFVLHSGMNNITDQGRVFDTMPHGTRKIILSTNIAETSITINDVVYVIDAGKMKQNTYGCIRSVDISQACAKQRAGRAGRSRKGFCYRLYSLDQYNAMDEYTIPELQRVPLPEICLCARIIAPKRMSIEAFLLKALQPPAKSNIHIGIDYLKQIDALNEKDEITELGVHLANMPVDCQFGKAILFAVVMRCVDPVVTIVSALSVKDVFLLPQNHGVDKVAKLKKQLSNYSLSDHLMIYKMFNQWSNQNGENVNDFCRNNNICNGNMHMIKLIKREICDHLNRTLQNEVDIEEIDKNSNNWSVVKACLTAGLYPNVCRIHQLAGKISSRQHPKATPHLSSVLMGHNNNRLDPQVWASGAGWMIYGDMFGFTHNAVIRNVTCISSTALVLFGGSMKLKCSFEAIGRKLTEISNADGNANDDYGDNKCEDDRSKRISAIGIDKTEFRIDDWISFLMDSTDAKLLYGLRQKLMAIVIRFLQNPSKLETKPDESNTINKIIEVLVKGDDATRKAVSMGTNP